MVIAAFASSSMKQFSKEVRKLGECLGRSGYTLVFGGCDYGLMHEIAEGFSQSGARVTGVVPGFFNTRNIHPACSPVLTTNDLTDRKEKMIELADAFLILPGGVGTMDELFTVLAQKSIGAYEKPVLLFNPVGFYDTLLKMLEDMQRFGAIREKVTDMVKTFAVPEEALEILGHA